MSLFERSLGVCGLSIAEAASLFQLPDDEMNSLVSGERDVPTRIWMMLAVLHNQLSLTTAAALAAFNVDMIGPEQMQGVALRETGDELSPPLLEAAIGKFILARFLTDTTPTISH